VSPLPVTYPDIGFYPLSEVPMIRLDAAGERELVAAEWGLLPFWWKPSDKTLKRAPFQRKTYNARNEIMDTTRIFREAFKAPSLPTAGQRVL
jgi:putative SOS response-associated peptidase YedK